MTKWDTTDSEDFSYEVAGAWAALSAFPEEIKIAVARYRQLRARGVRGDLAYYAVATWAAQARDTRHPAAPYHAIGFTEGVARAWCARIAEIVRDIEKAEERVEERGKPRGLSSIGGAVGKAVSDILRAESEGRSA